MKRILRCLAVLALLVGSLAAAPSASAYYSCDYVVTVYASGGQTCQQICHFYDNVTGDYQGMISREYRCG